MSIKEQIIKGTYKSKNTSVYDSIINGTYESKYQSKNNDYNSNTTSSVNFPISEQNKINLPTIDSNSNSKSSVVWNKKENQAVQKLPIVKNANNIEEAKKQNLPILPMNTKESANNKTISDITHEFLSTTGKSVKTLLNAGMNLARGIAGSPEDIVDNMVQLGSSEYNPVMQLMANDLTPSEKMSNVIKSSLIGSNTLNTALNMTSPTFIPKVLSNSIKNNAIKDSMKKSKDIENKQNVAKELIEEDYTNKLIDDKLGYDKVLSDGRTVKETIEDGSLIKQNNLGGQIFQSVGQMLPSMILGQATTGSDSIKEAVSLGTMALSSMAGGLEEAYNKGASREEAGRYALLNAAIETASEKMFAGIGGVFGKGEIDDAIKKKIQSKISNELSKKIIDFGLDSIGEGLEEVSSDLLQPIAQKLTYMKEEDLRKLYEDQKFLEDFVSGALSSVILQGMTLPINTKNASNSAIDSQDNMNIPTDNNYSNKTQTNENSNINLPLTNNSNINVKNIENKNNINYNTTEGDINDTRARTGNMEKNGQIVRRGMGELQTDERVSNILQPSNDELDTNTKRTTIDQDYGTASERRKYFEQVKNNNPKIPTQEQIDLKNEIKDLGIDLKYFIGKDNGSILGTTDNGTIYLDVNKNNIINENSSLKQRFYHELFHNISRNNNLNLNSEINELKQLVINNNPSAINKYIEDRGYDSSLFSNSKNIMSRFAEEVLADYSAKHLAGYNIDYNLSQEIEYRLNTLLDDAITTMKLNTRNESNNKIHEPSDKINLPDKEYYERKINELKSIDYDSLSADGKKLYDEELNRYESLIGNKIQEKINLTPVKNKPAIEINSKKYDLNKLTIDQLVKDKNQTLSNVDKKIEQKTNEYNLKKNKDTKIANNIKQQIEMLKNRKNNIEIDYNNKIQKLNSKNVKMLSDEQAIIEKNSNKITRKDVQESLLEQMGITVDDISQGKDINSIDSLRTDPIRLNEKVFGYKVGQKINDATINQTKYNEAERTRFLNKEREEIKNLGIKARSKESAAVQKYAEKQYVSEKGDIYKYGDYELEQEFPNVKTQEKIKKAAQILRNKYDAYIDQINEAITNMGYNPIPKRNDYMHHFNELNDKLSNWGIPLNMNSLKADVLPTDINGVTDQFKPGKNWFASAMHRTGPKTTYDAITGIDSYLEGASNLIYHTEDIQRYRTLSKYIRETYGQMHGLDNIDKMTPEQIRKRIADVNNSKLSKYAAWLDEQANSLAGKKGAIDRATERALGRRIYSILDTAKKQVGSNMTGFNVRSALTNFASSVQGASKTNKIAFVKGTISTLQNLVHNDGLINKSTFLTNRFGSDSLSQKTWQKISNAGQILMTGSDYFTANQIWRSKYYENLQKGMSEDAAIKHADDFSSRIMGDRSKGSTAEIFNSKTLGLLTQFQLEVNNQWSSLIHDNKIDIQSGNKSGASVLFQLGQLAAASYLFNNMIKSLTGSAVMIDPIDMLMKIFNPDDDDKSLEERAFEVIGDLVDNLPFGNIFTGGGRIPVSEAFTGASTFTKKVTNQTDSYGNEITWKDVKDDMIGSAFYWILPTGYGQLRKTSKGLSMYDKELPLPGSYTNSGNLRFTADESVGGKIKAALFGQYSSEEAQKYIESGYKSINKNHIDDMKQLNMTSSEYRNYRTELKNASQTTDKNGYIKYEDNNKNTYWYDKTNKVVYDNNYKQVNKSITSLNKVSSKEKVFEYINSLNISDQKKSKLINAEYGGEKTDSYGNLKYVSNDYVYNINGLKKYKNGSGTAYWVNTKTGNVYNNNGKLATNVKANTLTPVKEEKTYWYNETNNILYDSKYNKIDIKKLDSLTKVETKIDMSEYDKYASYEEYNYATSNPEKYAVINQITTYDKYNTYKEKIDSIKEQSMNKKTDIIKYVNSLNLSIPQKAMLIKAQYSSYNKYDKQIIQYINSQKLSINEKTKILQELGFTVRNGKVIS